MVAARRLAAVLLIAVAAVAGTSAARASMRAGRSAPAAPGPIFEQLGTGVTGALPADVKYAKGGTYALDLEKATIPVGGVVPWHCHPGPTTFIVIQGQLTTTNADGTTRVLGPGDADVEQIGTARTSANTGTEDVVVYIEFAPPEGLPGTIWLTGPDDKCKF
jgi:quercetin dioxygenase-like cupin family protein